MKLSYKTDKVYPHKDLQFPLGRVSFYNHQNHRLHFGSKSVEQNSSAQLSEAEVLAILAEVVSRTSARIKVKFEEGITLEFE